MGVLGTTATASFASAQRLDPTQLGPIVQGPKDAPANCPSVLSTDAWTLSFAGGNGVGYGTENKNGDWGGANAEGPGVLMASDGSTVLYSGHLHFWVGGGQNTTASVPLNQAEFGITLQFDGSGSLGTIRIHVDGHMTQNNNGTVTVMVQHASVTCS